MKYTLTGLSNLILHTNVHFNEFIKEDNTFETFVKFLINYIKNTTEFPDLELISINLKLLGQIAEKYDYINFISTQVRFQFLILVINFIIIFFLGDNFGFNNFLMEGGF